MKKITALLLSVLMCQFIFTSFSPSLDGRAVIADDGMMPEGLFARTVGYLPGDSISVTNLAKKISVDILVIGALDPSEGVAILLSPEAAKVLGMEKNANNVVKITKRSGQLDEQVSGTAVIADAPVVPLQNEETESSGDDSSEEDSKVAAADENASGDTESGESDYNYDWNSDSETEKEDVATTEPFKGDEDFDVEESKVALEEGDSSSDSSGSGAAPETALVTDELPSDDTGSEEKVTDDLSSDSSVEVAEKSGSESEGSEDKGTEVASKEGSGEEGEGDAEVITATVAEDVPESEPFVEKIEEEADAKRLEYAVQEEKIEADLLTDPVDSSVASNVPDSVSKTPFEEEGVSPDELSSSEEENKAVAEEKTDDSDKSIAMETSSEEKLSGDELDAGEEADADSEENTEIASLVEKETALPEEYESEKIESDELSELPAAEIASSASTLNKIENAAENSEPETIETENIESQKVEKDNLTDYSDFSEKLASKIYEDEPLEEGYAPIVLVQTEPKTPEYTEKEELNKGKKAENSWKNESSRERTEVPEIAANNSNTAVKTKENPPAKRTDWRNLVTDNSNLKKGYWYVQAALLSETLNIEQFVTKYSEDYPICLVPLSNGRGYQVLVGALGMDEYGTVLNRFKSYGFKDAFVKRIR